MGPKLKPRPKLKRALSTQLETDILQLLMLEWKSVWWEILHISLPSPADSTYTSTSKCSFLFFYMHTLKQKKEGITTANELQHHCWSSGPKAAPHVQGIYRTCTVSQRPDYILQRQTGVSHQGNKYKPLSCHKSQTFMHEPHKQAKHTPKSCHVAKVSLHITYCYFLSSSIKFPLAFTAAAFNMNSPPFPLSLYHIVVCTQPSSLITTCFPNEV